jgi:hypothetical protein
VPSPWADATVTVRGTASRETRQQLAGSVLHLQSLVDAPFELIVSGTVYPIGRRHMRTASVRVDQNDIPALIADDFHQDLRVRLVPDPAAPYVIVRLAD